VIKEPIVSLSIDRRDRVCVLTLDDPERRNALSLDLVEAITDAIAAAEADDEIGALVITGAPPAFCSGADTSSLSAMGADGGKDAGGVQRIYDGFLAVRACTLPTVAAVNGPAVGAGFNLALCCDVRIAGTAARFDSRFARIGLHPGGGHTWMLERSVGPQAAAALALFGDRIDGDRAVEIGLAWKCVKDKALLDEAVEFAARAADVPRELSRDLKTTLREAAWMPDFESSVAVEFERQQRSFRQTFKG
jgi:enoyl-CoA hydratase